MRVQKMSKSELALMITPSVAIGALVPIAALFFVTRGFNAALGLIVVLLSLLVAGVLGVVGIGVYFAKDRSENEEGLAELERLRILRATLRATAGDLDEAVELLKEIRDELSPGVSNEK